MQIVINISEDDYNGLKRKDDFDDMFLNCYEKAIINGIQLPKSHGRLKDVDWIDDNCENHYSDKDGSWCYTWRDIENAPTIVEADRSEEKE
jgi:hypothetical protein